ncbi:MAG TPA: RsmG family class I SAM-dependent methyltransferase, partial [Anaerovoracaceae bacterium]|nr:RsmG family class I SAM-dependent methyltransferase [Anaerovoracaceae bacterium]
IIAVLGLKNAKAVHGRAEDLAAEQFHREKYDICLSRAVAELPILAEYCLPFVRVGGYFGAYKTTDFHEELNKSKKALKILGGRFKDTTEFPIDLGMDHNIIWIEKTGKTPAKFPRRAGIPSKEPII